MRAAAEPAVLLSTLARAAALAQAAMMPLVLNTANTGRAMPQMPSEAAGTSNNAATAAVSVAYFSKMSSGKRLVRRRLAALSNITPMMFAPNQKP